MNIVSDTARAGADHWPFHDHAWKRIDPEAPGSEPSYTCDLCPAAWPAQRRWA